VLYIELKTESIDAILSISHRANYFISSRELVVSAAIGIIVLDLMQYIMLVYNGSR